MGNLNVLNATLPFPADRLERLIIFVELETIHTILQKKKKRRKNPNVVLRLESEQR
jgi:hypothetical protein